MLPASVKKVKQPTLGRAGEMKNADWAYDIKDVALERRLHKKTAPMVSDLKMIRRTTTPEGEKDFDPLDHDAHFGIPTLKKKSVI